MVKKIKLCSLMFIWVVYQCIETLDKWNAKHAGAMTLQNSVSRFQLNIL